MAERARISSFSRKKRWVKNLLLPEEVLATVEEIGEQAQLVIVIGGDGNMLGVLAFWLNIIFQ